MATNPNLDLSDLDHKPGLDISDLDNTPTGLPSINKSTGPQPSVTSTMINAGLNAVPGFGAVKQIGDVLSAHPEARRFVNEGGGMALGEAVGGPIGAGFGNAAGGFVSDIEDNPALAEKAAKILLLPGNQGILQDPEAAKQMLSKAGLRFTTGATMQVISGLAGKVISGTAGAVGNLAKTAMEEIPGASEAADKIGVTLNKAQVNVKSKLLNVMDKLARRGTLSSDTMTAFDEVNKAALKKAQHIITSDLAGGITEYVPNGQIADLVTSKLNLGEAVGDEVSNTMYSKLDDMVAGPKTTVYRTAADGSTIPVEERAGPGAYVPLRKLKSFISDKLEASTRINKFDQELVDKTQSFFKNLSGQSDNVSFLDAKNLRSQLLDLARESNNKSLQSLAGQAGGILDKSMEQTASDFSPEAYKQWRAANSFFKTNKATFNNDLMAKVIMNDSKVAEKIGQKIYDTGSLEHAQQLKEAIKRAADLSNSPQYAKEYALAVSKNPDLAVTSKVNYEDTLNVVRRGWLQRLFEDYKTPDIKSPGEYNLSFEGILGELQHPETTTGLKTLFPEEKIKVLKDFAVTGARAMKNASAVTQHAIGAVQRLVSESGIGNLSAKVLTNQESAQSFIKGLNYLSKASSATSTYAKQGVSYLLKAGQVLEQDKLEKGEDQ